MPTAPFNYTCKVEQLEQRLYIAHKAKNIYYLEKYDKPNVNQDSDLCNNLYYNSNPQKPFELYYVPGNSNLGETKTSQQLVSQGINGGDITVRRHKGNTWSNGQTAPCKNPVKNFL